MREAVDEAVKLEAALARLRTPNRIALLHYSPIATTVDGEPPRDLPVSGVYNASMPLLKRHFPDRPPFRILEVARADPAAGNGNIPTGEALTDRIRAPVTA